MLIGEVEGGSGYGQRQHGGGERHTGPLCTGIFEKGPRDRPAAENDEEDGRALKEQFGEGDWQYFAKGSTGTMNPLELIDWDWTSYYGTKYTKPLRVNADSIAPAGDGAKPV